MRELEGVASRASPTRPLGANRCAEMVDPAPRDPALATLADLELGRVLGRGASGRVLRVRDRRTAAT